MKSRLLWFAVLALSLPVSAAPLYFESTTPEGITRVVLVIEGDQVNGEQYTLIPEVHGTQGSLRGSKGADGLLRLRHDYAIEGADQSEEVLYKLEGDQLLLGEGELTEGEEGRLKLKNPAKVEFTKTLQRVKVDALLPGSPERKEVMNAMRGPVSAYIGKTVEFTGDIEAFQGWACFSGNAATKDGKTPTDPDAEFALSLDLISLLKKDPEGRWQVLYWGFAGDISAREEARAKFPLVPWVILR